MKVYEHTDEYFEKTPVEKQRVCCNCQHREPINKCEIDRHYIGYVSCFTNWCRRWKGERND